MMKSCREGTASSNTYHHFNINTNIIVIYIKHKLDSRTSHHCHMVMQNFPTNITYMMILFLGLFKTSSTFRCSTTATTSLSALKYKSKKNLLTSSLTSSPCWYSTSSSSCLSMATPAVSIDTMVNQTSSNEEETEQQLFHPNDFAVIDEENGNTISKIPYPTHLSPSAAMEFRECPQSFLFQYLYNIKQPTNLILTKGSMCHKALEHIFDLDPPDRTLENLQNMLRVKWNEQRLKEEYAVLFENSDGERDIDAEREWGQSALQLLENYYRSEDPKTVVRPNPYKREVWVKANLTVDPTLGITSNRGTTTQSTDHNDNDTFLVRGIVDRLDMVKLTSRSVALRVVDYKTGKAPTLKYSQSMNQQIFEKNFWQLKIYALLLREMQIQKNKKTIKGNDGMDLRYLKLHYLNSEKGRAKVWEMDLGETQEIRDEVLQDVHKELSQIWTDINNLVATQDPKAFVNCDRSFCYCHTCRERFVPGTVFDRSRDVKR